METTLDAILPVKQATPVKLVLLFIVCFVGNMFAGVVSTLMSVYLPEVVRELQVGHTQNQLNDISAYINSMFIFGWAAGGLLWGVISDLTGRKMSVLLSIACLGLFTLLISQAGEWWEIVACRFLSGMGAGGLLVVSFTLVTEVWPEKSKAVFIGVLSISIPVGIFSAGLINNLVDSWRQGFMFGIAPILFAMAGLWMISESGLWLTDRKRHAVSHGMNFGLLDIKTLLTGTLIFGTMLIGLWAIFSWLPTWIQSLPGNIAGKERGWSMMFLGMGGLTGGFFSGWLVNAAGMRRSLILSFAVCAVMSCVLFKTNNTFSEVINIEIAVLALFFGASQGILSLYIPMLFPSGIRASATGFCFNIGRIFTGIAVLAVGVLVNALGGYGNALFIFSLVFVIGLIATILIKNIQPETSSLKH